MQSLSSSLSAFGSARRRLELVLPQPQSMTRHHTRAVPASLTTRMAQVNLSRDRANLPVENSSIVPIQRALTIATAATASSQTTVWKDNVYVAFGQMVKTRTDSFIKKIYVSIPHQTVLTTQSFCASDQCLFRYVPNFLAFMSFEWRKQFTVMEPCYAFYPTDMNAASCLEIQNTFCSLRELMFTRIIKWLQQRQRRVMFRNEAAVSSETSSHRKQNRLIQKSSKESIFKLCSEIQGSSSISSSEDRHLSAWTCRWNLLGNTQVRWVAGRGKSVSWSLEDWYLIVSIKIKVLNYFNSGSGAISNRLDAIGW